MRSTEGPVSPKRRDDEHSSINGSAYKYYAAFSHTFVAQLLAELEIGKNDLLMDPWNGRGTTTAIAAEKGLRAIGFDLNPAMVAIAEARLVDGNWAKQAARKIEKLKQGSLQSYGYVDTTDSLLRWLSPSSVGFFRGLQAIFREIAAEKASAIPQNRETVINQRRLEYFLNLSLCSTLRDALKPLKTSNPTWILNRPGFSGELRV